MLMGRDGSIAKLDLAQDNVEVPVGEYSPYELSAVVKDPAGGEPWAFSFGRDFDWAGMVASRGYAVKAKGRVPVHPFDDLTLDAKLGSSKPAIPSRRGHHRQPRLETADHMTLRACYRSDKTDSSTRHPGAEIRLTTISGKTSIRRRPALAEADSARPRVECPKELLSKPSHSPSSSIAALWRENSNRPCSCKCGGNRMKMTAAIAHQHPAAGFAGHMTRRQPAGAFRSSIPPQSAMNHIPCLSSRRAILPIVGASALGLVAALCTRAMPVFAQQQPPQPPPPATAARVLD